MAESPIRVAYADPPYLGMASRYHVEGTPEYHPDAMRWDDPAEHGALMARLDLEYPDGWAFSLSTPSLRVLLPLAPERARVGAWVKPWASWKPGQWPAYAWEPVIFSVGHKRRNLERDTPRDFMRTGDVVSACASGDGPRFFGAKPRAFALWMIDIFALGEHPDDVLVDLFPGSGAITRAWDDYRGADTRRGTVTQGGLFACGEAVDTASDT